MFFISKGFILVFSKSSFSPSVIVLCSFLKVLIIIYVFSKFKQKMILYTFTFDVSLSRSFVDYSGSPIEGLWKTFFFFGTLLGARYHHLGPTFLLIYLLESSYIMCVPEIY